MGDAVEKVRAAIKQAARDGKPLAEAALAALEPDDKVGAGFQVYDPVEVKGTIEALQEEARQARAEEREACAQVADFYPSQSHGHLKTTPHAVARQVRDEIAAAIRGRSDD